MLEPNNDPASLSAFPFPATPPPKRSRLPVVGALLMLVLMLSCVGLGIMLALKDGSPRRTSPNVYHPPGTPGTPRPSKPSRAAQPTPTLVALSSNERTQVLRQVWTLVDTRYVYPNYNGLNWSKIYDLYRPRVNDAPDTAAFYTVMGELVDLLGDQHSSFLDPQQVAVYYPDIKGHRREWVGRTRVAAEGDQPTAQRLAGTNIVYLSLPTFDYEGLAQDTRDALRDVADAGPVDGLVVDVRDNGGGLLREMEHTLALLMDGGTGGVEIDRHEAHETIRLPANETLAEYRDTPVVVLISEYTGSAAERFAATIQGDGRGILLGTRTSGNTETLVPHDLTDGSILELAERRYLLPDGATSIEGVGLPPDLPLAAVWYEYDLAEDPQVLAAIKYLQEK